MKEIKGRGARAAVGRPIAVCGCDMRVPGKGGNRTRTTDAPETEEKQTDVKNRTQTKAENGR